MAPNTPLGLTTRLIHKGKTLRDEIGHDKETVYLLKEAADAIMQLNRELEMATARFYEIADTIDWGQ